MFKTVLIAEDYLSTNISVLKTLEDLKIDKANITQVYYCDNALSIIRMNVLQKTPIELLITDLYFEDDGNTQSLKGGIDLIKAVRILQPDIKILVFSSEKKASVIAPLFDVHKIDAYVPKARNDSAELVRALNTIYFENKPFIPAPIRQAIKQENAHEFTEYDVMILSLLAKEGMKQKDIPAYLKANNIQPSGLSSVEKRLNHLKEKLGCSQNGQLVAFCKDQGII